MKDLVSSCSWEVFDGKDFAEVCGLFEGGICLQKRDSWVLRVLIRSLFCNIVVFLSGMIQVAQTYLMYEPP